MPAEKKRVARRKGRAGSPSTERPSTERPPAESKRSEPGFAPTVVWYRLYTLTDLISRPFWNEHAKRYLLSQNDWRVLATLAYQPGIASHEICRITGISPMNVSRSVAALRQRGRLQETPDPNNRVRKHLELTTEGLALYDAVLPSIKKSSKAMLATMTEPEVATLTRLVEKLIAHLETLEETQ